MNFEPSKEWIDKFWSRVDKSAGENGCWLWTGARKVLAYGTVWIPGLQRYEGVHRVAFFLSGRKTTKLRPFVRHSCHTPLCVNQKHLSAGSPLENSQDMVIAGRQYSGDRHWMKSQPQHIKSRVAQWIKDNPRQGEAHSLARLKKDDVVSIRQMYRDGSSQADISERYGICVPHVSDIVNRKKWKCIP